jgi:hypothetical protein
VAANWRLASPWRYYCASAHRRKRDPQLPNLNGKKDLIPGQENVLYPDPI